MHTQHKFFSSLHIKGCIPRVTARACKAMCTEPWADSLSNREVIWMIRTDLISLFQKPVLGIILPVFRRLNQQFDELGALLQCSTGLKGKLLFFWMTIFG